MSTSSQSSYHSLGREEVPNGLLLSHCSQSNAVFLRNSLQFRDSFHRRWIICKQRKRYKFSNECQGHIRGDCSGPSCLLTAVLLQPGRLWPWRPGPRPSRHRQCQWCWWPRPCQCTPPRHNTQQLAVCCAL